MEFIFTAQTGKDKTDCRKNIVNVLKSFCIRHPEIGYHQVK